MQHFLIGVVIAAIITLIWVRHTREARRKWVEKLDLIGIWETELTRATDLQVLFTFSGQIDRGDYELRFNNQLERGTWCIVRSSLVCAADPDQENVYEVRLFAPGKIGLNGPNLDHRMLVKRVENIVPLRR